MSRIYRTHANQKFIAGTLPVSGTNINSGTGSLIVPTGVYQITFRVHGGGGAGAGRSSTGTGGQAGGAGGAVAISTLSVKPGQTIFYSVATNRTGTTGIPASDGFDSWVRIGENAPPTTTTQGVLAKGGKSAGPNDTNPGDNVSSAQTFFCIGTTIYRGGNGRAGGTTSGGGGSGAGTAADGNNATGTAGASAPTGGGNGGSGSGGGGGNGGAGSQPGGGGGGSFKNSGTARNGGAGAAGRITIIY